jgi:hypothetical protein
MAAMSQAVVNDLLWALTALLALPFVLSLIAVFRDTRPDLDASARARLEDLVRTFEEELNRGAEARAAARKWSRFSRKDVRAEYLSRRTGKTWRVRLAARRYRAFSLAVAGALFALPVIPHLVKLSEFHKMLSDLAGAGVAIATFGFEGSDVAAGVASRFYREPKNGDRAQNKLTQYGARLGRAVESNARSRAATAQVTAGELESAWGEIVIPFPAPGAVANRPGASRRGWLARLLTALAVGAGLYFGVPFARTKLVSSGSYWPAAVIPLALLIGYLLLTSAVLAVAALNPAELAHSLSRNRRPKTGNFERGAAESKSEPDQEQPVANAPENNHAEVGAMSYGGPDTKRRRLSFAWLVTLIGESIGLLNKGSANTPAAPGGETGDQTAVSSNSLNVTRVGGVGALISGAGGAALLLFKVNKAKDPHSIVVAAYISVGVIVAAALVAVAMIIVADIRARSGLAAASATTAAAARKTSAAQVKYIETVASGDADMAISLDRAYDFVIVNAAAAGLKLTLPTAASERWQQMSIKRDDDAGDRAVTLFAQDQDKVLGQRDYSLAPRSPVQLYSDGASWLSVN